MENFAIKYRELAAYAADARHNKGRRFAEDASLYRTEFQRDRDRIIHSTAFRRLEYKTQVFVNHEGDHYRTRLTHSLEVAQIARVIAKVLMLDDDLTEALALAHDLGHTPFGHAGEEALREEMREFGGFCHNAHSIKLLTSLEKKYAAFDGLNLTWDVLEGIAKHNGPVKNPPRDLAEYNQIHDLKLHSFPSIEAQIAALADDIAYHNHDLDDGLRAGLFKMEELFHLPIIGKIFQDIYDELQNTDTQRIIYEAIRKLIGAMVMDLIDQTAGNIKSSNVSSVDEARNFGKAIAEFSSEMEEANKQLKSFLMQNMYRHYKVNRATSKARRVVRELFRFFYQEPECLPKNLQMLIPSQTKAIVVSDYIAAMTDRYAMREYKKIFDISFKY